jgi:hypothetical protein
MNHSRNCVKDVEHDDTCGLHLGTDYRATCPGCLHEEKLARRREQSALQQAQAKAERRRAKLKRGLHRLLMSARQRRAQLLLDLAWLAENEAGAFRSIFQIAGGARHEA